MSTAAPNLAGLKVLLGVSSSIAAHRALDLASALRKAGAEVRAVLTSNVPNLIGPAAFDAITHQRTITTLWGSDFAGEMDHLAVTKWADLFVVLPATANTLATLAHGLASDALGTFAVAWNKNPMILCPAMNPEMWRNNATKSNVATLKSRGHQFIGPVVGRTACDDEGAGRLASVDEVLDAIVARWHAMSGPLPLAGKTVLITSGPTREFADAVRCITNPSTGKQGAALAKAAAQLGATVVMVSGPTALPKLSCIDKYIAVTTADEMLAAVLAELPRIDIAIFAAAVSDWKPVERSNGKEKKSQSPNEMELHLIRTPDIAATANKQRRAGQLFVGFAAETENLRGYAGEKMEKKGFALVFANPINEAGAGFGGDTNMGLLLRKDGSVREVAKGTKEAIAHIILEETIGLLNSVSSKH